MILMWSPISRGRVGGTTVCYRATADAILPGLKNHSNRGLLRVSVNLSGSKFVIIMFQSVASSVSFPKLEEKIIQFWKDRAIYEQSLSAREGAKPFIFYEGPPTANGLPHPGHCLTRAIKDLFPRYKTMRGYLCERKAGWDTHGLPVEVEVCKELGIHSKEEIEAYGVEPFIRKCIESVFRYTQQWEHLTERLGFWIHLDEAYVTFHQSYVESVWWALEKSLRPRTALPRAQNRLVVGARRHGLEFRRSRAGLPRSGRSERVRAVSAGRIAPERRLQQMPISWFGPPRRGRCRAISSRRSSPTWSIRSFRWKARAES